MTSSGKFYSLSEEILTTIVKELVRPYYSWNFDMYLPLQEYVPQITPGKESFSS